MPDWFAQWSVTNVILCGSLNFRRRPGRLTGKMRPRSTNRKPTRLKHTELTLKPLFVDFSELKCPSIHYLYHIACSRGIGGNSSCHWA